MSTIQIVGIAVAAVIVVLLVVALLVTRKGDDGKSEMDEARETPESASFLDSPPSDTLSRLGTPEHVPPGSGAPEPPKPPATPPGVVRTATGVASAAGGLGLDWDRAAERPAPEAAAAHEEAETTGEMPAVAIPPAEPAPEPTKPAEAGVPEDAAAEVEAARAEAVEETPAAAEAAGTAATDAEAETGSDRLVPLSSIIVTTSTKMVDLDDPEIRRMLTDLVTFEIDQATQFRQHGQSIDAVLQLTEAEKICRALGKVDTAREIRDMMRGLQD